MNEIDGQFQLIGRFDQENKRGNTYFAISGGVVGRSFSSPEG
jgi:hypothetical protein